MLSFLVVDEVSASDIIPESSSESRKIQKRSKGETETYMDDKGNGRGLLHIFGEKPGKMHEQGTSLDLETVCIY